MRIQTNLTRPTRPAPPALRPAQTAPIRAAEPLDKVTLSRGKAGGWKHGAVKLAAGILSAAHTLCSLPGSLAMGLAIASGQNVEVQRSRAAVAYSTATSVMGGALGALVGGPVGLVCGAFAGYIAGNVGNQLAHRSGLLGRQLQAIGEQVQPGQNGLRAAAFALKKGLSSSWTEGQQANRLFVEGLLDGTARPRSQATEPAEAKQTQGILKQTLGAVCGATGVLINAPGGAVVGALEAIRENDEARRSAIARTLMLLATNAGKMIPGAAVAALLGGPGGVAIGTAVGLVTASLTTIIDGKYGINQSIVRQVEKAVQETHEGEPPVQDLEVFYRAGQGAMAGAISGTYQGWQLGYLSGVKIAGDLVSVPGVAVK